MYTLDLIFRENRRNFQKVAKDCVALITENSPIYVCRLSRLERVSTSDT